MYLCCPSPPQCFSSHLDFAAIQRDSGSGEDECISIFDIGQHQDQEWCTRETSNIFKRVNGGIAKRSIDFRNRYELNSGSSCMAFDEAESSIVCGTDDGDLFILA